MKRRQVKIGTRLVWHGDEGDVFGTVIDKAGYSTVRGFVTVQWDDNQTGTVALADIEEIDGFVAIADQEATQ